MQLLFVVNRLDELVPTMTTAMLIDRAAERGHRVWLASVDDLALAADRRLIARAQRRESPAHSTGAPAAVEMLDLARCDGVVLRSNPARDGSGDHRAALELLGLAAQRGVPVINDPRQLARQASKVWLAELAPEDCPATVISRDPQVLGEFLAQIEGPAVLKPLGGTRGRDVLLVGADRANLRQLIDVVTRGGYAMAQAYVPEAAEGDVRVVLVNGEIFRVQGQALAVRRIPARGDFRSNLHAGGSVAAAVVSEGMQRVAARVGPRLAAAGIWLAGLDFIGDRVIEINVFATGGFHPAEQLYGKPFAAALIDALGETIRGAGNP